MLNIWKRKVVARLSPVTWVMRWPIEFRNRKASESQTPRHVSWAMGMKVKRSCRNSHFLCFRVSAGRKQLNSVKAEKLWDGRRVRVSVEIIGVGVFRGIGRNLLSNCKVYCRQMCSPTFEEIQIHHDKWTKMKFQMKGLYLEAYITREGSVNTERKRL